MGLFDKNDSTDEIIKSYLFSEEKRGREKEMHDDVKTQNHKFEVFNTI